MTERDMKRASILLKDELRAFEDITETYDFSHGTSDTNIKAVIDFIGKEHPDVLIVHDKVNSSLLYVEMMLVE